jgi:hypothetical protein
VINYRDSTVLVTGASAGLGVEFANQLAARGANLILVARRLDRMDALAATLRSRHGVTVTTIAADLSTPTAGADLVKKVTKLGLPVHSLINNAGFGTHNPFGDEKAEQIHAEVALNVATVVDLTKAFWPELLSHGTGVLVNVASSAGFQPVPRMAVYGATKAFVLSFTEALWFEAKGSGLKVLALCPGATETEFFDTSGPGARIGRAVGPEPVIRLALSTLDRRNPPPTVIHGFTNRAQIFGERLISRRLLVNAAGAITRER